MIQITDVVNNMDVSILCDDPNSDCILTIVYSPNNVTIVDKSFKNARILSATLRDTLGLGPAKDLLAKHGVPRTNPLWDLNHSDLWQPT